MRELNTMLTNERKTRLKPALYKLLVFVSVYLLGGSLSEELKKVKSRHFLVATISKRQKTG